MEFHELTGGKFRRDVLCTWSVGNEGVLTSLREPETCHCPPPSPILLAAAAAGDGSRPHSETDRGLCRGSGRGRRQVSRAGLGQLARCLVHPSAGPRARLSRSEGVLHGRT